MVLSDRLRERLAELDDADLVEVVVELHDHDGWDDASVRRWADPVVARTKGVGGSVVGIAWINATLKALVPAGRLDELAGEPRVARIDLPSSL